MVDPRRMSGHTDEDLIVSAAGAHWKLRSGRAQGDASGVPFGYSMGTRGSAPAGTCGSEPPRRSLQNDSRAEGVFPISSLGIFQTRAALPGCINHRRLSSFPARRLVNAINQSFNFTSHFSFKICSVVG